MHSAEIPVDPTVRRAMGTELVWMEELGGGYSAQALHAASMYDASYWRNYEKYAESPIAEALNRSRVGLVNRYLGASSVLVDIGIGAGTFIEARGGNTLGYDVNPIGVEWLQARCIWVDPYTQPVESASFWDVLEHIHDPATMLANVHQYAFVSLPIFRDARDVLASKHYKPNEHIWYWTRNGLIRWMAAQGFACVEHGTPESLLGRESIHSFVFRRV